MRLLSISDEGRYKLNSFSDDGPIPPYAILSHTWLQDHGQEPTFQDVQQGTAEERPGYWKIRFCGDQARRDGLQYFWVDTCCINKEDSTEVSLAINSMFRWYKASTRCYVYLVDVFNSVDGLLLGRSGSDFSQSKWFTRGWTLQELLAPKSLYFFSSKGDLLGKKELLMQDLHAVTRIPLAALQGAPMSQFSIQERYQWMEPRKTTVAEDKVYALLGIFEITMPLYYGEGAGAASTRLQLLLEKRHRLLQDLRLIDPRDEKKRIEEVKGGLLDEAYYWVLQNRSFQQWSEATESSILWIKGDPGKGKTMLLCGIINVLHSTLKKKQCLMSHFFCQATDSRTNSATAVLRGLLFMLLRQQPSLASYIQVEYDVAGKSLFEDRNARFKLTEFLRSLLADPALAGVHIIIDALDECSTDRTALIQFIIENAGSRQCTAKWIVSSRNWPDIEKLISRASQAVRLSLELNAESVAAAVSTYIYVKVNELGRDNEWSKIEQDAVRQNLELGADGTFLWIALVCLELRHVDGWEAKKMSRQFPSGLESLYGRMMEQIAHLGQPGLCREILAIASIVQRPLTLDELSHLVTDGPPPDAGHRTWSKVVESCGSFLTVKNNVISFVHQSAKDYLVDKARNELYPSGTEQVHAAVCTQSLQLMLRDLRRDMYNLEDHGISIHQVKSPNPDPLTSLRYSCVYWINHYLASMSSQSYTALNIGKILRDFLLTRYLYWLEASSLCRSMSEVQISFAELETLVRRENSNSGLVAKQSHSSRQTSKFTSAKRSTLLQRESSNSDSIIERSPSSRQTRKFTFGKLSTRLRRESANSGSIAERSPSSRQTSKFTYELPDLIYDAYRFLMAHKPAIEGFPLQTYASALLFSPNKSFIRLLYAKEQPSWFTIEPPVTDEWSACLQTLEGHGTGVLSVAFSPDSTRLASASDDRTVKVWDARSGTCLQTLEGHGSVVSSVAFSPDSTRLASTSWDRTVKVWDARSGACLQTLEGHGNSFNSIWDDSRAAGISDGEVSGELGISSDRTWIVQGSRRVLWLPPEYRPRSFAEFAVSQNAIGIGTGSGKVWMCKA